jgi:phytoene dehydrogenase-like protein
VNYDVIIIGGGLGGLCAGAKLAKEGKHILLLEQHDRPGGCATTFTRKEYTMEVGLHEMDGLHPSDGKTRIFNDLGLFDGVEYLPLPEFYRFYNGRTDLVMPHGQEEAKAMLKEHFPGEAGGIDAYFHRLMNARRINVVERDQPDISVGEFLDATFTSEEIKLVLLGNLGYFHDDPYSLSLRYFSMAESAYFHGRANFIQGGSQQLSDKLVSIIRAHGGKVLLNHRVTSIDADEGRIRSVRFINTLPGDHSLVEAKAEDFIANAALPLISEMIHVPAGKKLSEEIAGQPLGASLLTVYYGFSTSLKALGHNHYSTFVFDGSVKTQKDIKANNRADFSRRGFTFVDYSQVDSRLAPEGKSVGAICCIDYLDDWKDLSKQEYRVKKQLAGEQLTDRLEQLIPGCRNHIAHMEVGTSKTVQRYTLNPNGAVYGFAQVPDRPHLSSLDTIENLHVASAWGKFGGGFSGAIFSGYMTAVDLLRRSK